MRKLPRLIFAVLLVVLGTSVGAQGGPEVFETETLNAGLGQPPGWIDRSTPQGTVESLMTAAAAQDWAAAAHLLDLSDLPPDRQQAAGPELAEELYILLDRKVLLDWWALPDRPDAALEPGDGDPGVVLQPRRAIRLWTLDLDGRPVPISLARIAPGDDDPLWVFSAATVRNVPELHDTYRPSQLELAIPEPLRETGPWGLRYWELVALPVVVGLVFGGAYVVWHVLASLGRLLAGRGGSLVLAARAPLTLALVTFLVSTVARSILIFSGRIDAFISPLTAIGYVVAAFWLVASFGDALLDRMITLDGSRHKEIGAHSEERRRTATRVVAIRRALVVAITLAGIGIVLNEVNVLRSLGVSLLASAGAVTLLLGFAGRNVLANIMASMQIALNGSAKIGDRIVYRDRICTVERINFTYVQLLVWTGERLIVPVVDFVDEPFENWTKKDPSLIRTITLKLAHCADADVLLDAYHGILDEYGDRVGPDADRGVNVTGHDVFGQDVLFRVPCRDPNEAWTIECEVRQRLLAAAAAVEKDSATTIFPKAQAAQAA